MKILALLLLSSMAVWPRMASASGGVHHLSLEEAVRQASVVLVVEKATPPMEKRVAHVPVRQAGATRREKMQTSLMRIKIVKVLRTRMDLGFSTSGESLLRPGKTQRFSAKELQPGRVMRVVDSQTITNHQVRARYLADGTREIPLYRRLRDEVRHDAFLKQKRFVFLGGYSVGYEALRGVGGSGLVSIEHLAKVRRLLKSN